MREREQPLELSVSSCLESVGISRLSEWDVLAFLYRRGTSLANADQIARPIGYESGVVSGTLDRLKREKLIERSRTSQGVRLYRIAGAMNAGQQHCLQQLVNLSETRGGRLLLAKQLQPVNRLSLEKEASGYL